MIAGFEREIEGILKTGVEHSSRARFATELGRPGGFGSSAMPKTRQQCLDLKTQAVSGRPCWARMSAGMYLYCDGRVGSAAQAAALPWISMDIHGYPWISSVGVCKHLWRVGVYLGQHLAKCGVYTSVLTVC